MRRISIGITCVLAVAMLGCIASSSALAMEGLVLKTSSGPLAANAPVEFQSSNFVIESQSGNIECEQTTLAGELPKNGGSTDKLQLASATATGDFEPSPGVGGPGYCKTSAFGPALVAAKVLPWSLELNDRGAGEISSSASTWASSRQLPKKAARSWSRGSRRRFAVGGPLTVTVNSSWRGGAPPVARAPGTLRGAFTMTSNGEPVDSEVGSVTGRDRRGHGNRHGQQRAGRQRVGFRVQPGRTRIRRTQRLPDRSNRIGRPLHRVRGSRKVRIS